MTEPRLRLGSTEPRFDPFADGFFEDPSVQYAILRERNPVHVNDRGIVFCFAYDDVRTVLIETRSTSMERERALPSVAGTKAAAAPTFPLGLLNRDPPDHTRLRRLLARAFTSRGIERLMSSMDRHVDRLLDDLEQQYRTTGEPVDLVNGLAFPFPFRVISELLGMPDTDDGRVRALAHQVTGASDPIVTRDQLATAVSAYHELRDYIATEVVEWKRRHPGDDLFTLLLAAEDEHTLSRDELLDNISLLYVAGHETTTGLIGNGILNLLRHRAQLERLQHDPDLLQNAIEELNRYESSIQFAWRYVVSDLALRDVVLPPGTMAFVCCGSANRDPDHFGACAAQLDITRPDAKDVLSFGAGIHYCLGAPLARREAALVIGKLFGRFPTMEIAGAPVWGRRVTFRSLDQLPVMLG